MRKIIFTLFCFISFFLSAQENICDYKNEILRVKKQLIQYFQNFDHSSHPSLNQRLLLYLLNEEHQLKMNLPKDFLNFKIVHKEDLLVQKYYFRLLHRKYKFNPKELKADYEKTSGIDHLLLWSIYPDFLPFDEECKNTIQQPLNYEAYSIRLICHLALAYYWAKQFVKLEVSIKNTFEKNFVQWQNLTEKGLQSIKGYVDTAIEGYLTYIFIQQHDQIPFNKFKEFLYYSSPDGSYSWDEEKNTNANFHASLIALWLVCELESFCK